MARPGFSSRRAITRRWAEKLVLLLKDPILRARMGDAALKRARERFTVERMVEETAAVYERLTAA